MTFMKNFCTSSIFIMKFQDESSVLKAKQLLERLHMAEERDFLHVDAEVHRVIKMPPPPKKKTSTTISKVFTLALAPFLFISVGFLCEIFMLPDLYILLPLRKSMCTRLPERTVAHIWQGIHQFSAHSGNSSLVYLFIYLFVYLFIYLFIYVFIYFVIYLFIYSCLFYVVP